MGLAVLCHWYFLSCDGASGSSQKWLSRLKRTSKFPHRPSQTGMAASLQPGRAFGCCRLEHLVRLALASLHT